MRKVWAASTGSYSDYRVRCLFATREDAEKHISARKGGDKWDEGFLEEFVLYEAGEQPEQVTYVTLQSTVKEDGSYEDPEPFWRTIWASGEYDTPPPPNRPTGRTHTAPAYGRGLRVIVKARTLEQAQKAFHDRVIQAKTMVPVPLTKQVDDRMPDGE